ncbi:MAG: hypothetical protein QOG30_3228, partial [Acidimicrobiaceae bacterium]
VPRGKSRAGRQSGGERTVGHTDVNHTAIAEHARRERVGAPRQWFVAPEVASRSVRRKGTSPGFAHFDARREHVERRDHRFEGARIACGIVLEHDELRATTLRLAASHVLRDTLGSGRRRTRHHSIGEEHGCGLVQWDARGDHRPIRTPNDKRADRAHVTPRCCGAVERSPARRSRPQHHPRPATTARPASRAMRSDVHSTRSPPVAPASGRSHRRCPPTRRG